MEISQLAQVTDATFKDHHRYIVKRINRAMKCAIDNPVSLKLPKLWKLFESFSRMRALRITMI